MMRYLHLLTLLLLVVACSDDNTPTDGDVSLGTLTITMNNASNVSYQVQLRNTQTNSVFTTATDPQTGSNAATFRVPPGIYEATVTGSFASNGIFYTQNGTSGQITVHTNQTANITVELLTAKISQVVIKELYCGGCIKDDGVTNFQYDKCMILYNNSSLPATLDNLCVGMVAPANAQATNNNYTTDGQLNYEGFIPAWQALWYFQQPLTIEPYAQVVVNIHGAIDNTLTVSHSVNYANSDYYCMFDPESGFKNASYYPTPSELIPSTHYLKACVVGLGNAWALSVTSPALFVFQTKSVDPDSYARDVNNHWYDGGGANQSKLCVKVPDDWVVDAIEVFSSAYQTSCVKRFTANIDAGYVWLTNHQGHSLYRNVDREATEALPENAGRLVYNYSLGVDGSTDSSGIDAEASIHNGAHIIYQDTNNSTNDFHERQLCSLKD
jgi:hypothetical protein